MSDAAAALRERRPLLPQAVVELGPVIDRIMACVASHTGTALVLSDLPAADSYRHEHDIQVCALGLLLGRELFSRSGWEDERGRHRFDGVDQRLHDLGMGLLLHDIGKVGVPAGILNKPSTLTAAETELVRRHPQDGARLLDDAYSPLARAVVLEHHERWDGTGYPSGRAGRAIHQLARVAAVADVYDSVTSERSYQRARSPRLGYDVIVQGAGTAFDPEVVAAFRRLVHP
jgi:HD-GYP domain-containing protein (c-di-GMP phosphodiesterase class II)